VTTIATPPPAIALQPGLTNLHASPDLPLSITQLNQVAFVVRDLDAAVHAYWERLRVGPWRIYTYGPDVLTESTYYGEPAAYRMRLAFTWCGPLQVEIIQPLDGPSVYHDFLEAHGEGMHHVGIFVEDFDAAVRAFEARGYRLLQTGRGYGVRGDGAFAYFETEGLFATTLELICVPKERRPPEAVYPPDAVFP
jgi:catechol 2,3-dioxygenase-like lactoylglutathione lyase family enzyme